MVETDRKPIQRDNFGPGKAGEIAYFAIAGGTPCESATTHTEDETRPLADRTIGFDIAASYELAAVCSDLCEDVMKKSIEQDLIASGRTPSFDRNGFGRA